MSIRSRVNEAFYTHSTWRNLKIATNTVFGLTAAGFLMINSLVASFPEEGWEWIKPNAWRLVFHWVGFVIFGIGWFLVYRKQPEELKSGANGRQRAKEFMDELDWIRFSSTQTMLSNTLSDPMINRIPGLKEHHRVRANQALEASRAFSKSSSCEALKPAYTRMMVARFQILSFIQPNDRLVCGRWVLIGVFLMAAPHVVNFLMVPFRLA